MTYATQQILLIGWLLLTSVGLLHAQTPVPNDKLHRLDRSVQSVLVKEVSDSEVFYTEPNAPTTVRKIRKADLWKVVYGDGTADVYNQPKTSSIPPSNTVVSKPQTAPIPVPAPQEQPKPVATRISESTPSIRNGGGSLAGSLSGGSIDVFSAGRSALSVGLNLSGSSTTTKTSQRTTKLSANTINLSLLFQQFTRENVSVGGGLRLDLQTSKSSISGKDNDPPFVALSGQIRRYLPVADQVAFYGFGSAEIGVQNQKTMVNGKSETIATNQLLRLRAGAGLAYVVGSNWSLDLNTSLVGLDVDRYKSKAPNSKASAILSLSGAGVASSLSLFLTRYF